MKTKITELTRTKVVDYITNLDSKDLAILLGCLNTSSLLDMRKIINEYVTSVPAYRN